MTPALLSLTEDQVLAALRRFLLEVTSSSFFLGSVDQLVLTVSDVISGTLSINDPVQDLSGAIAQWTRIDATMTGTGGVGTYKVTVAQSVAQEPMVGGVGVYKGQVNRVPEPLEGNFVVMTPMLQDRLATNVTTYADNVLTGTIVDGLLTVSAVTQAEAPLLPGTPLLDTIGNVVPGTVLGTQIDGAPGGVGMYNVAPLQRLGPQMLYAGLRNDLARAQLSVQLDFHGPLSGDNVRIVEGLFRSEFGVEAFVRSGYDVRPLYSSAARQAPFINEAQQYEYKWTLDVELDVAPVIGTPQQFANKLKITTVEADTL